MGWRAHRLVVDVGGRQLPVLTLVGDIAAPGLPPRLYIPKGPACAADDDEAWPATLRAVAALARETGATQIIVEPAGWQAEDGPTLAARFAARGTAVRIAPKQPAHTAVVSLLGDPSAVLARMKPKGRYNVRLAERRGVVVRVLEDPAEAGVLLARLAAATASRQSISLPGAPYYRRLLQTVPGARLYVADVEGETVSGALVASFAGEAIYLYGGSLPRHRDRQPSALVHWQAMCHAMAEGCGSYDLWGIPPGDDPAHPWHGLRQFKLSLGGVEKESVGAFQWVLRPLAARATALAGELRHWAGDMRRKLGA